VEGVEALGLDRCVLGSLEGIERFKALRGLWIGDVELGGRAPAADHEAENEEMVREKLAELRGEGSDH
jgi:hypothetical protein